MDKNAEEIKNIIDKLESRLINDCERERDKKLDAAHFEAMGYKKACNEFADCLIKILTNMGV